METKLATRQDTKTALIEAGMQLMLQKGYSNTGIQEVLQSVNVPKGSFYHYFDSKENFAVAIIDHFDACYASELVRILSNTTRTPLQRLRDWCEASKTMLVAQQCAKGCLIGNLSQEMADQSEVLRSRLSEVMSEWRDVFANCIAEGQQSGEIASNHSAHDLAELLYSAWSGAVMMTKTIKSPESLNVFIKLMFEDFLKS